MCGKFDASQKNVTLKSNEVTISFRSGPHRSGRGFLLSYATDQYPGMISVAGWLLFTKLSHGSNKYMNVVVCVTLLMSYYSCSWARRAHCSAFCQLIWIRQISSVASLNSCNFNSRDRVSIYPCVCILVSWRVCVVVSAWVMSYCCSASIAVFALACLLRKQESTLRLKGGRPQASVCRFEWLNFFFHPLPSSAR